MVTVYGYVFIGKVDGILGHTIAHELTHVLLNTNDNQNAPQTSLALNTNPSNGQDTITAAKRLPELLPLDVVTNQRPGVSIESHLHHTALTPSDGFVETETGPLDIEEWLRTPRQGVLDLGNNLLRP